MPAIEQNRAADTSRYRRPLVHWGDPLFLHAHLTWMPPPGSACRRLSSDPAERVEERDLDAEALRDARGHPPGESGARYRHDPGRRSSGRQGIHGVEPERGTRPLVMLDYPAPASSAGGARTVALVKDAEG
jgi:hypothetical protein